MFDLKHLSADAVPGALAKAERYRLLGEPVEAESICRDVLDADPDNQEAVVTLILALTDQFAGDAARVSDAVEALDRLQGDYQRAYCAGIIRERRAKAVLSRGTPRGDSQAYDWFRDAMTHYERAEAIRPPNNDDALLRWNACARIIMRRRLEPRTEEPVDPVLSE
ncbi:MAG: hypothetical protein FJW23_14310 [Acidimicrobiia bacterium]|nr:hypothetical protein [Acidimicrobiia bacterium]